MSHLPLIFKVILQPVHLQTIDKLRNLLADMIIEVNEISVCNRKLLGVELSRIALDFRELMNNCYVNGYKWNSYVIRMAILKINYVYKIIEEENKQKHSKLLTSLSQAEILLSEILFECFNENQSIG